jgi:hypothetical protein
MAGIAALIAALVRLLRGRREQNTALTWHLTENLSEKEYSNEK